MKYLAFTTDFDEQLAIARFTDKYGEPPDHSFISNNLLRVGPIPEDDDEQPNWTIDHGEE